MRGERRGAEWSFALYFILPSPRLQPDAIFSASYVQLSEGEKEEEGAEERSPSITPSTFANPCHSHRSRYRAPPHRQLPPPQCGTTRWGPRWSPVDGGAPVYPAPISRAGRRGRWPSWRGARCHALGPSIAAYGSTAGCCRVGQRGSP